MNTLSINKTLLHFHLVQALVNIEKNLMGYSLWLVNVYKVLEEKGINEWDNYDKWPFYSQISFIAEPTLV